MTWLSCFFFLNILWLFWEFIVQHAGQTLVVYVLLEIKLVGFDFNLSRILCFLEIGGLSPDLIICPLQVWRLFLLCGSLQELAAVQVFMVEVHLFCTDVFGSLLTNYILRGSISPRPLRRSIAVKSPAAIIISSLVNETNRDV